jgi:hypothetical protein
MAGLVACPIMAFESPSTVKSHEDLTNKFDAASPSEFVRQERTTEEGSFGRIWWKSSHTIRVCHLEEFQMTTSRMHPSANV